MSASSQHGHSAKIEAYLLVEDQRLSLERIGGGRLAVREAYSAPPETPATVEVTVDGERQTMPIILSNGIQPGVDVDYR
jgi:hypothetical protein